MYLGIDVGATKTLFAVFDDAGQVVFKHRIPTPHDYEQFKDAISKVLGNELAKYKFTACCCAIPGWLDYEKGIAIGFGVLPWHNVPIQHDLQQMFPSIKLLIHNDAKLAGLSEAILLKGKYDKVLYLTISTGIGGGVILNGFIAEDFANFEPGQMVYEYEGQTKKWEDFASGSMLKEKYGKLASEIDDPVIWQEYVKALAVGFRKVLDVVGPDIVIVGGGVGSHFEKFQPYLEQELKKNNNSLVHLPPIEKAKRPEEAVIYGCYEYIKQKI